MFDPRFALLVATAGLLFGFIIGLLIPKRSSGLLSAVYGIAATAGFTSASFWPTAFHDHWTVESLILASAGAAGLAVSLFCAGGRLQVAS